MNNLKFWIESRQFHRHMLGQWNMRAEREYSTESLKNVAWTTRCLVDEIRQVEARLGLAHRHLPKAGFYQGRITGRMV